MPAIPSSSHLREHTGVVADSGSFASDYSTGFELPIPVLAIDRLTLADSIQQTNFYFTH